MKIPIKFKVFATTVNVGYDNTRLSNDGVLGDCSFTDSQITLCSSYKGEDINACTIADTFYHEKIHIVLDAMGEHELSKNEKFIEVFARLLRQANETAEY